MTNSELGVQLYALARQEHHPGQIDVTSVLQLLTEREDKIKELEDKLRLDCEHKWLTSTKSVYTQWDGSNNQYRYIEICLDCRHLQWSRWFSVDTELPPDGVIRRDSDLEAMMIEMNKFAVSKHWWDDPLITRIPRLCKWLHEEVDEVLKAWEDTGSNSYHVTDDEGHQKPEGLSSELIDILFIVGDIAYKLNVDLVKAGREKLAYNKIRRYKRDWKGNQI